MKKNKNVVNNLLELVGNTPMVQINKLTKDFAGTFLAKLESANPGHSSKDRIALHIVESAERKGILKSGDTIIETTSGNTGFSLAMVSLIKGYQCILAVSSKSSTDKIDMLRAMGAKVYVCPANVAADDPRSYYEVAKRLHSEIKGSIYINQYFNDLNADAHYSSTGPEIWNQTDGAITHFVASLGTSGTFMGCTRFFHEHHPHVRCIAVQPDSPFHGLEGMKHMETAMVPSIYDPSEVDQHMEVPTEESFALMRLVARKNGFLIGPSCAGALWGALEVAKELEEGVIVVIFPDSGERYTSESHLWEDS